MVGESGPQRGSPDLHRLDIVEADMWAKAAAGLIAERATEAIARRGQCLLALSGGSTPRPMFDALATMDLPWDKVVVLQVDERLVPSHSPDRNLIDQRAAFAKLPAVWLPFPVDAVLAEGLPPEAGPGEPPPAIVDTSSAMATFADRLRALADDPPILDVVHLGLGDDGHTASLFPDDPATFELRQPVAITGQQKGNRRLTLTRSVLDRARSVIWLVRGQDKAPALGRLLAGDLSIPAGVLRPAQSVVVADTDAARQG